MTNHPADPRSNALGELPFDPNEYPNQPFTPTQEPPAVGTAYIPYRGQEYHGTAPNVTPWDYNAFTAEQAVEDERATGGPPLREPVEPRPVPVSIVDSFDLSSERIDRFTSFQLSSMVGQTIPIAPYDQQRELVSLIISNLADTAELLISDNPFPTALNSLHCLVGANNNAGQILYETNGQNALYCSVLTCTSANNGVILNVMQKHTRYQGLGLVTGQPGKHKDHRAWQ